MQKLIKQSALLHSWFLASPRLKALFEIIPLKSLLPVHFYSFITSVNGQPRSLVSNTHVAAHIFVVDFPDLETCLLSGEIWCTSLRLFLELPLFLTGILLQGLCMEEDSYWAKSSCHSLH